MAKRQARATLTRERLLRGAAAEFARHGYDGTSFAGVCAAAQVTMGALTFHYATKTDLAQSVTIAGMRETRLAVEEADRRAKTPLESVYAIALALVDLLEGEQGVRATARLARERPELRVDWRSCWMPLVLTRVHQAEATGQLRPGACPQSVALLVGCLVAGVEAGLFPDAPDALGASVPASEQFASVWRTALEGVRVLREEGHVRS